MFDPVKIQDTLESLQSNATSLRNIDNLNSVSPVVLELLLLRAHIDLTNCIQALQQLADERDSLREQLANTKAEHSEKPDSEKPQQ